MTRTLLPKSHHFSCLSHPLLLPRLRLCARYNSLPYAQPFLSLEKGDARWISSTNVKACQHCAAKFTMLLRKHHCRACGSCLCNNCSPYKRTKHMERMCRRCNALERGAVFDVNAAADTEMIIDAAYQGDLLEVNHSAVMAGLASRAPHTPHTRLQVHSICAWGRIPTASRFVRGW